MKLERPRKLKSEKMRFLVKPIRESAWRKRFGKKTSELADPPLPPTQLADLSLPLTPSSSPKPSSVIGDF